jgi:hypothetical protein
MPITQTELAREWGISKQRVNQLVNRGLPLDSLESANDWRASTSQRSPRRANSQVKQLVAVNLDVSVAGETPEDTIKRLRRTEKALAIAREQALSAGSDVALVSALRREHATAAKILLEGESRLLRLAERREKLVSIDVARGWITAALGRASEYARRLPDTGTDEADKAKLDKIANEFLTAIRSGGAAYVDELATT